MIVTQRERERGRGKAGSMHQELDVGLDPGSPGSCPRPKAGTKPLCHPGIPNFLFLTKLYDSFFHKYILMFPTS